MHTDSDKIWFEEQIRDMQDSLYNVAYSLLRNHADAEDAVCEAIVQGWNSLPRLKDRTYFKPWQMKILKYNVYTLMRKNRHEIVYDDTLVEGMSDVDDSMEKIEERELIRQALYSLPPDYRLTLILFYMEDYSIKEIAKTMNCTQGTVKSRLSRGRDKLRVILEGGANHV
ncbi:MAG: RNA polymerase sigma factor [Clostridia bacterium]|nr:RNA polymerase sigma factor [Clostridia bacterium]